MHVSVVDTDGRRAWVKELVRLGQEVDRRIARGEFQSACSSLSAMGSLQERLFKSCMQACVLEENIEDFYIGIYL
jgi:hypothetical protein